MQTDDVCLYCKKKNPRYNTILYQYGYYPWYENKPIQWEEELFCSAHCRRRWLEANRYDTTD